MIQLMQNLPQTVAAQLIEVKPRSLAFLWEVVREADIEVSHRIWETRRVILYIPEDTWQSAHDNSAQKLSTPNS